MIIRSIITGCIFLILYSLLLPALQKARKPAAQNQWQENFMKAENYLYASDSITSVIVGSSLANRLRVNKLPKGIYNLSFAGLSVFDGLAVVLQKQQKPKIIFIELNMLKRKADKDFTKIIEHAFFSSVRNRLPVFRKTNQPVAFAGIYLKNRVYNRTIGKFVKTGCHPIIDRLNHSVFHLKKPSTETFAEKMIQRSYLEMNTPLPEGLLQAQLEKLQFLIEALRKEGVKVVLFEMPMDLKLENSLQMQELREQIKARFLTSMYQFAKPDYTLYKTTDGLHLTRQSADLYSAFFTKQVISFSY